MKLAFITGITGQDGSYLAELLLGLGYQVHGLIRRHSTGPNFTNIQHIVNRLHVHYGDMTDSSNIRNIIFDVKPDEIYNLAAQSQVGVSFQVPSSTSEINGHGVLNILEAARLLSRTKSVRFYQASTSELYGKVQQIPQSETTPFYPRSPYAVAKLYAYWMTVNYRESYDLFACNGILFNHESPRRGIEFVTKKIVDGLVDVIKSQQGTLYLGNLDSLRDWGHARDYVRAMHMILQHNTAQDYVVASGQQHSVRYFCEVTAKHLGIDLVWEGTGVNEVGKNSHTGQVIIGIKQEFYRPAEVHTLLGNASRAREVLGWQPEFSFEDLVADMVNHKINQYENSISHRRI